MKYLYLLIILFLTVNTSIGQVRIEGQVVDSISNKPITNVSISRVGFNEYIETDGQGMFGLTVNEFPVTLVFSHLGYSDKLITINNSERVIISLVSSEEMLGDVVITASKFKEYIQNSPSNIHKIDSRTLEKLPVTDFYDALNFKANIDVVQNSFGLKVFNTRGFGTTSPFRVVQIVDGIDNMAPVLNFSPGSSMSLPEIDISNVEVISGPASALYGPNALQGVINIQSKDPFIYQGFTVKATGGNQAYFNGEFRYADTYGKKDKFGFKITGAYSRANDWEANDSTLNLYRKIPYAPQNIFGLAQTRANDATLSEEKRKYYQDFVNYVGINSGSNPKTVQFTLPGYQEKYLTDYNSLGVKLFTSLAYNFNSDVSLSYLYKFNLADMVYQGNNRAYLNNYKFNQHKLELKGKNFLVKTYLTHEDLNDSYDLVLTGINMGIAGLPEVTSAYLENYIDSTYALSSGYTDTLSAVQIQQIKASSLQNAENGWLQPNTDPFNNAFEKITTSTDRPSGSKYTSKSIIYHLEGQYDYSVSVINLNFGGSFRNYFPKTFGEVFEDTLRSDGTYNKINYYEFGMFTQLTVNLLNRKMKLIGSLRLDKSKNFNMQFSPRLGLIFNHKEHNFRLVYQTAFRSPTLNDQFFNLNVGALILKGNLNGFNNLYTSSSLSAYLSSPTKDSTLLKSYEANPIEPEQLNSIEIGYRLFKFKGFSVDFVSFFNRYANFIGSINVIEPKSGVAGEASGLQDVKTRNYSTYRIWVNSENKVNSIGTAIELDYKWRWLNIYTNYTFNKFLDENIQDDFIPGFNTPKHKLNIGFVVDKAWKGLGGSMNFRWSDAYFWESPFANGPISAIHTMDAAIHYDIEKLNTIFKVGANNLYNRPTKYAAGAAVIKGFYYLSITYDLNFNRN